MKMIFLSLLLLLSPCLHADESPLRVGMELSYPPFEMVGPDGQPSGVSPDIAFALGKYLNKRVLIENISYIGLIPALKGDKIDLIISSLTITEERKKSIDFSEPYATTGLCLLVNIHSNLNSIEEANRPGRTIVVKSGTSGEVYAAKYLGEATVRVLDKEAICVLEVVQGKADAFIYDQLSIYTHWQKNLNTTRALLAPFQKEYWGIGIRKGNSKLLEQVNLFINKFREEGGFDKLANTYLSKQKEALQKLGIPFIF